MKIKIDLSAPRPNFVKPELLLHPPIPRPLHGLNPRTIKGQAWWDKHRKKAFELNNHCCWACGVHKSSAYKHNYLEGHEIYDIDYKHGRARFKAVAGLCYGCHAFIHQSRLAMLLDAGQIPFLEYRHVVDRGADILYAAGLLKQYNVIQAQALNVEDLAGCTKDSLVPWSSWRLIIGDKAYPPRFPSYTAWRTHYQKGEDD